MKKHVETGLFLAVFLLIFAACGHTAPPGAAAPLKLSTEVQVTPVGGLLFGSFSRIGYVPARKAMIVTFDTFVATGAQPVSCMDNEKACFRRRTRKTARAS
jgi:hypothetical protein